MRILLVDDQPAVRSALRYLLGQQPDIEVVGEASSGEGLLEHIRTIQPDVVLLDWELPHQAVAGLLADVRAFEVRPKMVVFSSWPDVETAALNAGADAFVSKSDSPDILLSVLHALGRGNCIDN